MRLGSDLCATPANIPFGWIDGDSSPDTDGRVTINIADEEALPLGSISVGGMTAGTRYVAMFNLDIPDGIQVALLGIPAAAVFSDAGLILHEFIAPGPGVIFSFRAAGTGLGYLGPAVSAATTPPIPLAVREILED